MRLHTFSYWLLIFFTALLLPHISAQLPGMKIYTQLDGYPGTTGYRIYQDARGFIWIGTSNGAVRFDGKRFMVLDDKNGLTDKEIVQAMPYGQDEVLLLPLLNNLALYKNGTVITAAQRKNLSLHNKITNTCMYDKATGKVWLSDGKNLTGIIYCLKGDSVTEMKIKMPSTFSVLEAMNDQLYMVFNDHQSHFLSMGIYDVPTRVYTPFKFVYPKGRVYPEKFGIHQVSHDGRYVAAGYGRSVDLFEISHHELRYIRSVLLSEIPRTLAIDKNNHLWASLSSSGVEYCGSIAGPDRLQQPLHCLDELVVNGFLTDRDDNLWLTTEQKGLCFISARHWQNARLALQWKLPPCPPRYITGDGSSIYIGHSGKSCFTCIKNGHTTVFDIPGGSPLGSRAILKLDKHLFIASNLLARFIETGHGLVYEGFWARGAIKDVIAYNHRLLILAEHDAAVAVKLSDLDKELKYAQVFEGRASALELLPDSSLLVGTPNGLFAKPSLYAPASHLTHPVLKSAYITDVKTGRKNFILVGTNAQGLYRYNFLTAEASPVLFPSANRPASVRNIFRQNDSVYWISTDKGVIRLRVDTTMQPRDITGYTFFDGLPSNDVSCAYVQRDTAYIATSAGLGILPLNARIKNREAPGVLLNAIRIEDSLVAFPGGSLHLSHLQNNIQLSLSALSYESMGTLRFMYRLLGLSEKWRETESPEISFSGLSPGSYQFEAYALTTESLRSATPLRVSILVQPAFWQTGWFMGLLLIPGAALVLFLVYRGIVHQKNKQYHHMQQKKRLAELELEAIKAQINPHFVYNCLNSIQYFSYKNDFEPVKQYLDIFALLIRQTMQYSQESFITLDEEVNYLNNYLRLEKVRFKAKLHYTLEVDEALDRRALLPSMLIQPYVENALKHGVAKAEDAGRVRIRFGPAAAEGLLVIIEDNGPGVHSTLAVGGRKPWGLRLSGSRAETYNQLFGLHIRISMEHCEPGTNGHSRGTRVKLLIPPVNHGNIPL